MPRLLLFCKLEALAGVGGDWVYPLCRLVNRDVFGASLTQIEQAVEQRLDLFSILFNKFANQRSFLR